MFICTLKATNIKFFAVVLSAVVLLVSVILLTAGGTVRTTAAIAKQNEKIVFDKIRTNEDRVSFLGQYGWEVKNEPTEEVTMKLPSQFDKVMTSYNEIQKTEGLDLTKYKGKEVTRYTYEVTNYPGYDGTVYANVIVCKNRVIGGDICSADVSGFIRGFTMPEKAESTQ